MKRKEPSWLKDAIFYEIYPQSFYDSNNDGIGDLKGIIQKLDYIKDLGCNAVWINPCFVSPFQDAGYDVADYYKIAPRYGTNDDMKRLCKEANKKGIRILLDLVPGHTSIQHPWFKESCRPEKNKYSDWFIWTDSAWTWSCKDLKIINGYADRDGCYITNFFYCQPALNYGFAKRDPKSKWQQPVDAPGPKAVRNEIKKIMRFWLDMGVSGFRVDMAGSLVKNDPGNKMTSLFWKEIRDMLDRDYPDAVIISEWSDPEKSVKNGGFHVDFLLPFGDKGANSLFRIGEKSFFNKEGKGNIRIFLDDFLKHLDTVKNKGYIAMVTGNHDCVRIREGRTIEELKPVFAFLLTLPSIPFIYYGDEIGIRYLKLPSKEGGYGRTGSRTPMQWTDGKNKGFSKADYKKLYLPVDLSKDAPSVESQIKDPDSLLNTVKKIIQIRKRYPALSTEGDFKPVYALKNKYPFVFSRRLKSEEFIIAVNPSKESIDIPLKLKSKFIPILCNKVKFSGSKLHLSGISFGIFKKESSF